MTTNAHGAAPCWPALDTRAHVLEFYREDGKLIASLTECIESALREGDAIVVIASATRRAALRERLTQRDTHMETAEAQGRYASFDAAGTLTRFMAGGLPDAARFGALMAEIVGKAGGAAHGPRGRAALFGEMEAMLWRGPEGPGAALRLEQLWNALARAYPFSLRCAYPWDGYARSEAVTSLRAAHSLVIGPD